MFYCAMHHSRMVRSSIAILIIDESPERAALIELALREAGHHSIQTISRMLGMARQIEEMSPDVIIMDLGNPNRDFLEHMFRLSKAIQKPVAMFVDQSSEQAMLDAIEAGVSAYVVDGLKQERIKSILDLAIMRFRAFETLRRERDEALLALDERKMIDRARGIVMRHKGLDETSAFELLRNAAMTQGRRIGEVADAIVQSEAILPGKQK
jgi:two-component system, response regulator / RNA-binding antiterminator